MKVAEPSSDEFLNNGWLALPASRAPSQEHAAGLRFNAAEETRSQPPSFCRVFEMHNHHVMFLGRMPKCSATTTFPLRVASPKGATKIHSMEERAKATLSGAKGDNNKFTA